MHRIFLLVTLLFIAGCYLAMVEPAFAAYIWVYCGMLMVFSVMLMVMYAMQ